MADCPPPKSLELFLSDELSEPEAIVVRSHVASCSDCQVDLDRLTDVDDLDFWRSLAVSPLLDASDGPALGRLLGNMRTLSDPDLEPESRRPLVPPAAPVDLGPYTVECELGRGGMGVVYLGRDPALGRRVAIKVLHTHDSDARSRRMLVREAQLAASFRHENAVTIHALIEPPDGPPYLVMEYLAGPTLAELIRSPGGLDRRQAVRIAAEVADALGAAHEAGLVHRDVKPGNILIDPQTGRAKLADFGLARTLAVDPSQSRETPLAGTPTYMSPEQAEGREPVDARSDVYSLGATLYEALSGEVPFRGTAAMVLKQVFEDEPRPLRRLDESTPRDLETICLRSMAKLPVLRYGSAREVAEELRRWLAGEPIRARPVGLSGRLLAWCRRRPALGGLSAALVAAVLAGVCGVAWEWREADRQRRHAEENFADAMEAVDQLLTRVAEVNLAGEPGLLPLRRDLYKTAGRFYQRFTEKRADDPAVRDELGRALYHQADLTSALGSKADALAVLGKALVIQESRHQVRPTDPTARRDLARSLVRLGDLQTTLGLPKEAEAAFVRAADLLRPVVADGRRPAAESILFGQAGVGLWMVRSNAGRLAEAEADHRSTAESIRLAVKAHPQAPRLRSLLAGILFNLSEYDLMRGQGERAEAELGEAMALLEGMPKDDPAPALTRGALAASLVSLAKFQALRGQLDRAGASHEKGVAIARDVADAAPGVPLGQYTLALILDERANFFLATGRLDEAARDFEESRSIKETLLRKSPGSFPLRVANARALSNLGRTRNEQGRLDEAIVFQDRAIAILNPAGSVPASPSKAAESLVRFNRAQTLFEIGRFADAADDLDRCLKLDDLKLPNLLQALRAIARARDDRSDVLPELRVLYDPATREAEALLARVLPAGNGLYRYGTLFALAVRAVSDDPNVPEAEQAGRAGRLAERAVALLERSRAAGYFRVLDRHRRLVDDPELAPIRGRDDFQRFAARLKAEGDRRDDAGDIQN
jgi:tetratricopeptide (TPR) repeat protein